MAKNKTMGIVGTRDPKGGKIPDAMVEQAAAQTTKALNSGWRIATGGASGVDSVVMQTAIDMGKGNMLDIYLPKDLAYQPYSAQQLIKQAEAQGATVKYDCGYTSGLFGEKSSFDIKNRNTVLVENSEAVVAIQSGGSRGTEDTIMKAKEAGLKVKVSRYISGFLQSTSFLNCLGAVLGAIGVAFDFTELNKYLDYVNKLLEKYRNGETTEEENQFLLNSGALQLSDGGDINESNMDGLAYVSGSNRGNPYHDKEGKFCSAENAVTVSG